MARFSARTFSANYGDELILSGALGDVDSRPVVELTIDVGDEQVSTPLDAYHLRELRLALQRAERWLSESGGSGSGGAS